MTQFYQLEFEREVAEIERRLAEARRGVAADDSDGPPSDVVELERRRDDKLREVYAKLRPWDIVRTARHPARPQTRDYIGLMCRDFMELHGDRRFGDDPAIVTGFARLGKYKCLIVGHQKGKTTEEKIRCHFGCAHPEGYRKALAKMKLAAKLGLPVVTLVDTPGAYPGLGAEQRGQALAIAENMLEMSRLRTPIVSVVIGEGGSGGALGIAVADRVGMLRHAWYSVISPEGCAAILWKQANEQTNAEAAVALKLSAEDNVGLGVVDEAIDEPLGAAHRDPNGAAERLQTWIVTQLDELVAIDTDALLDARYERFRRLGRVAEVSPPAPDAILNPSSPTDRSNVAPQTVDRPSGA